MGAGGLLGLLAIAVVAGLVSGVAEVLGMFLPGLRLTFAALIFIILLDLGSSDDNLTLPLISGGCTLDSSSSLRWRIRG